MVQTLHIAIIMDGNGRWAKKQNKPRSYGHLVGTENVRNITKIANKHNISCLTLYAFSTENWSRDNDEVNYLMKLPKLFFDKYINELMKENVKVSTIGDISKLPEATLKVINRAKERTKDNSGLILNFAMNYGSQAEIINACQKVNALVLKDNDLVITKELFESQLDTADLPAVDLLIRTSGEVRLSNFLLYQLAYAEMMFVDEAWPEFTQEMFVECLDKFKTRDRRFGGTK